MGTTSTTQADIDLESALAQAGVPLSVVYRLSKALPVVRRDEAGTALGVEVDGVLLAGSGVVDLASSITTTSVTITNTGGSDATIPESSNSTAGVISASNTLKLAGISAGATANASDASLRDRGTHTGTQLMSTISDAPTYVAAQISAAALPISTTTDGVPEGATNKYHTSARVLDTALAGLSVAIATDVVATDTMLVAAGKLQAQLDAVAAGGSTSLPVQNSTSSTSSSMAASTAVVVGQAAEARSSTPGQYPATTYTAPDAFSTTDWITVEFDYIVANPTVGDFRGYWPLENFQTDQTTPTFVICYPRRPGSPATNIVFTWEVRKVGTTTAQQQIGAAGEHTMRWLQELERGAEHEWRVKRSDSAEWSTWRPFKVRADATTWIFKTKAQTLADIKAKSHPRAKPLDLEDRVRLYQTGGALRAYTTAAISTFTGTWSPLAIPTPGTYTVNTLMTEYLIQVNCWWLEQIDGGGTYKTEALRRLRAMITGGSAFTTGGVPSNTSTDIQSIRTLCIVLAAGWDLWQADLSAGDKTDLLALADAKLDLLFDNVATGVSTLDGILGFPGLWRSVTYTNRLYLTYACACFAGDTGLSAQMISNTDTAAARVEFLTNWWHNFGTHDGINSESDYYASTDGFLEPNIIDMAAGLIDRDLYTARPHVREWVEATAVMFPYTAASRLYPFSDSSDTSTGSIVKNMGLAFKTPPAAVTQWLNLAYPTTAAHAAAQAGQATSFLNRAPRPVLPNVRKLGTFHPDAGLAASNDGKASGVELWTRCSPLGSHTHFMADHASYNVGHGGKMVLGFPGMYKWSPSVSSNPRRASCKSIAHNTIGMDLVDYDGGGGGTYFQCAGQQKWSNQLTGTESHLMKTRGRFPYERETAAYQALVADATEAYWDTGYTLSKAWRATVHIRPGLIIFIDACDSSSGAHTWHHQFKSAVLPTYSAPWVTVSDSPGLVTLQVPYASGTVSRTLGNQGWWDAQTPTTGTSIPAAPYNNSFDLPSATTMRMAVVAQVGADAVTGITASKTGDVITVAATYQGRPWVVNFNDVTGALTIDGETDASALTPFQGLQSGIQFKDEGSNLGTAGAVTAIDVTGAGGTASLVGTTLTLSLSGGGSAITVQDEGTPLSTAADTFNFVGAGVTASGAGTTKTITIPGGGDFSSNTASSVDGEVVVFSGTAGKTGKRATGTGLAKLTSGVLSTATSGTDYAAAGTITGSGLTMATARIIGRTTASTGAPEEITVGSGLVLSGGALSATGGGAATITVKEDGTAVSASVSTLDFLGADFDLTESPAGEINVVVAAAIARTANVQPVDADLTALAGVSTTGILRRTGAGTASAGTAVALSEIANIGTDRLLGRDTAASGVTEELTVGGGIEFTGSGGIQTSALTGDVTKTAGGTATTIANAAVTLAKMANLAQDQVIGRTTASTGVPETFTVTAAARTVLDDTTTGAMLTTLGAQPLDADLTTIAGLTATTDNFLQAKSSAWASRTPTQVAADLRAIANTVTVEATTARTLAASDNNTVIRCTSASATTITVPTAFSTYSCTIVRAGTGTVTIAASSTTLNGDLVLNGANTAASIIYAGAANTFDVIGSTGAIPGAETTVASATTTDIGATATTSVSITGTTTITGLGTAAAGTERICRFTGVLTLTHNSTSLILPNAGSNITTAAGDRMFPRSLGSGNWVVDSYVKASGAAVSGGGSGTVTHTGGALTSNSVVLGAGSDDAKVVAGIVTDGTSKLTLGVAGTSVGGVLLANATSGTVELRPVTGALGTAVISVPAATDTMVTLAATQTLTNKTLTSPTLTTPALGTPASGTLTNATGLPVSTGISGLGTGVATFLATPSSANFAAAITDETGTGSVVLATAPTFPTTITVGAAAGATGQVLLKGTTSGTVTVKTADAAGTYTLTLPTDDGTASQFLQTDGAGVLTWASPAGSGTVTATGGALTANSVVLGAGTTDTKVVAGITTDGTSKVTLGVAGTSVGSVDFKNATSGTVTLSPVTGALGTVTLSLPAATDTLVGKATTDTLTNKTLTSPTLTTPVLGTPSSGTLTNCTGLPIAGLTMATARLLGRTTASAGAAEEITVGSGLSLAAGALGTTGDLLTISGLTPSNDDFLQRKSGAWANRTIAQIRTDLQGDGSAADSDGFRGTPLNSQSAAYTMVLSDGGKCIYHPTSDTTARTWTIPANGSVAYPIGTALMFDNDVGAGALTIAITTDTLVLVGAAGLTGSRTLAAGGTAVARKVTSTRWRISGSAELT